MTSSSRWRRRPSVTAGLAAVPAVPLVVAAVALRDPRWHPALDLAWTELRLRDVGTGDTPLVGLAGRFEAYGLRGSHLGPISFYALWPFYLLFGASAWAMQVAAAALNVAAAAVAVWIGGRRGGPVLALGVATVTVVLMRAYGADMLTLAWNPYMPMLWWVVFLLAVWSVLCGDRPLLPVAAAAGTFCVQTHFPYLGLVAGTAAFGGAVTAVVLWRARRRGSWDRSAAAGWLRWGAVTLALLVGLWMPPLVQQVTNRPGNLSIVAESYRTSDDPTPSVGEGVSLWLEHMDVRALAAPPVVTADAGALPGALLLTAWLAAAGIAGLTWYRRRPRGDTATVTADDNGDSDGDSDSDSDDGRTDVPPVADPRLLRLHAVVGVALGLGLISITRIQGDLWFYLTLWGWGTTALLLLAVGWTAAAAAGTRVRRRGPAATRAATVALSGVAALAVASFVFDAARVTPAEHSSMVAALAPATDDALRLGELPGSGEDGRYLVRWHSDAGGIGGQGYGMLLELERRGLTVGAVETATTEVGAHRVLAPEDATATLHHVVGAAAIRRWHDTQGAVLVAEADLRSPEEVARFDRIHGEVVAALRTAGADDLVDRLDRNLLTTAMAITADDRLPDGLARRVQELMDLGLPAAVFLTPPDVVHPTP